VLIKILLGVLVLAALGAFFFARAGDVSGSQARQLVASGARLVDVRTPAEFAAGHIEGAINVPVDQLGARLGELGERDGALVVYCRSGNRSATATRQLRQAGFTQVHDLGAMTSW
jgi:rhodanese-related sulfurtransferase